MSIASEGVRFLGSPDREYQQTGKTLPKDRTAAGVHRAMPKFSVGVGQVKNDSRERAHPTFKLPETNLTKEVARPAGLGDTDKYMWDLAMI